MTFLGRFFYFYQQHFYRITLLWERSKRSLRYSYSWTERMFVCSGVRKTFWPSSDLKLIYYNIPHFSIEFYSFWKLNQLNNVKFSSVSYMIRAFNCKNKNIFERNPSKPSSLIGTFLVTWFLGSLSFLGSDRFNRLDNKRPFNYCRFQQLNIRRSGFEKWFT